MILISRSGLEGHVLHGPPLSRPWRLREKLSALLLSCIAPKAGGLPSLANPARRMRRARVFHAPFNACPSGLSLVAIATGLIRRRRAANVVRSYLPQGRGNEVEVAATESSGAGPESRLWAGVVQRAHDARTAGPDGE